MPRTLFHRADELCNIFVISDYSMTPGFVNGCPPLFPFLFYVHATCVRHQDTGPRFLSLRPELLRAIILSIGKAPILG